MRIPLNKVYRAFPELDRLSDAECQMLMERLRIRGYGGATVVLVTVLAVGLTFVCTCVSGPAVMEILLPRGRNGSLLGLMLVIFVPPAVVGFAINDFLLKHYLVRAIRVQFDRCRCPGCKYILIGQRAAGGAVSCPECARVTLLSELAITEADLIPPPPSADVAVPSPAASQSEAETH